MILGTFVKIYHPETLNAFLIFLKKFGLEDIFSLTYHLESLKSGVFVSNVKMGESSFPFPSYIKLNLKFMSGSVNQNFYFEIFSLFKKNLKKGGKRK